MAFALCFAFTLFLRSGLSRGGGEVVALYQDENVRRTDFILGSGCATLTSGNNGDAQQSVYYDNTVADPKNDYTYDALYRLIRCEGREHAGSNAPISYNDSSRIGKAPLPTDASAMRRYVQYYKYDEVGNMLQMKHTTTGGTGNWTRNFVISGTTNQLTESSIGSSGTGTESYDYDNRGNMVDGMNHLLSMTYNEDNRLEQVDITSTQTAYYQYDHDGQRIRKVITNTFAAISQVRKYVGDWEVYQKIDTGTNSVILERETLHVDDHDKRIALIDTPTIDTLSTGEVQLLRYQFSNNISTASLELDENAAVITYEEYYPYGNTSYQGGRSVAECSLKRYRYTGKERDEENGLNYHGARYYAPWLARWCSADPINSEIYNNIHGSPNRNLQRQFIELTASTYEYCYANPVRFIDPTGEQPKTVIGKWLQKLKNGVFYGGELKGTTITAKRIAKKTERSKPDTPNSSDRRAERKARSGREKTNDGTHLVGSVGLDIATSALGAGEVILKELRQNNLAQKFSKFTKWGFKNNLWGKSKVLGTQAAAGKLQNVAEGLGKVGRWLGAAGIALSTYSYISKVTDRNNQLTSGEHAAFWIGATVAVIATAFPVFALVYGAIELISTLTTGKSIWQHIIDRK